MKKIHQSKTIIFNTLTILVVVATFFGYTPNQELSDTTASILLALSPLINIALRFVTDKKLSL